MEITLLGTGGMMPLKNRFLTSLYAEHEGGAVLIDCGEGTQVAFGQHGMKLSRLEAMCFTHRHADHVAGLPGLLLSLGNTGRTEPLPIYCGKSCADTVRHLLAVTGGLPFEVTVEVLPEREAAEIRLPQMDPLFRITTLPLSHSVPCIGYRIELGKKPEFQPDRARALDIPVQFWKRLHAGETVTLEDGRTITSDAVTGQPRKPLVITYTTDTLPIPSIAEFAKGSDLFICEGMYGDPEKKASLNEKRHMLMQDACRLAKEAGAARLWLTHFSPAEKHPQDYEKELHALFPDTVIPQDGMHITLK